MHGDRTVPPAAAATAELSSRCWGVRHKLFPTVVLTTLLLTTAADGSTVQLAISDIGRGGMNATTVDGTFGFDGGTGALLYGNATTRRVSRATPPDGYVVAAAAPGTLLLVEPSASGGTNAVPQTLNTRTGALTIAPGARYLPGASYSQVGRIWISGAITNPLSASGSDAPTFINRVTGQLTTFNSPLNTYNLNAATLRPRPRPVTRQAPVCCNSAAPTA